MAYISSGMSDQDINSVLGLRQQMDAQRNQTPLDEMMRRAVAQGQRAAPLAAGVPGQDSQAPGWQNPALSPGATPATPPSTPAMPTSAAQGGGQIPAGNADPLARLSQSSAWQGMPDGAAQMLTGAESVALRRQTNPSFGTPADAINQMLGTGPYAGMLPGQYLPPGLSNLGPAERMAMISRMNDLNQTGIQQQAENRLGTEAFGLPSGITPGAGSRMASSATADEVARQRAAFETNARISRERTIEQAIGAAQASGHPMSPQQVDALTRALERANPLSAPAPATGGNQTPLGPQAAPQPGAPPQRPAGPQPQAGGAGAANLADALANAHTNAQGQPDPITNIVHELGPRFITPENMSAIRDFIIQKFGVQAAENWYQTRDSALPDFGVSSETPAATARRMVRQAAGHTASSDNANTPLLMRMLNLIPNRQYR